MLYQFEEEGVSSIGRLPSGRLVVWRNKTRLPKTGKEADINLLQKGSRNLRNANLVDIVDPVLGSANLRVFCVSARGGHKSRAEYAEIRREPAAREHCPRLFSDRSFLVLNQRFLLDSLEQFLHVGPQLPARLLFRFRKFDQGRFLTQAGQVGVALPVREHLP